MASWVLRCPHCNEKFLHSEIENTFANFFDPQKPKFPKGGQNLECVNCGRAAVYQQSDLIYQRGTSR